MKINHFTIGEPEAQTYNLHATINGHGSRAVQPGTYTRISSHGQLWMTDTPAEISDHFSPVFEAKRRGGRVLIHGLGIGLVVNAILRQAPTVTSIDVVEVSPDVIALVGSHYEALARERGVTLNIIEGDAYTYRFPKGSRWQVAWHDIWPTLSEDNLPQMATMNRRYGRAADWQGYWGQTYVRYQRDRYKRAGW